MSAIIDLIVGPLGALLGSLIAIGGAFFFGRSAGKNAEQKKRLEARLETRETRDEIDDAVAGRSESDVKANLKRW